MAADRRREDISPFEPLPALVYWLCIVCALGMIASPFVLVWLSYLAAR